VVAVGALKYRTIVADPPWDFGKTTFRSGAGHGMKYANRPLPYPSMSSAEIASLPVGDLADKDAHLFLWTTSRHMREAYDVVDAWGFTCRQVLVWVKPDPMPMSMPFAPPATEFVLACSRGKPRANLERPLKSSALVIPRGASPHSAKPEAFMDAFELLGDAPRLELFARRQRLGWDTWGNECRCDVEMAAK